MPATTNCLHQTYVNLDNRNLVVSKKNIRVVFVSPSVIATSINKSLPHIADPERRRQTEVKYIVRNIESIV